MANFHEVVDAFSFYSRGFKLGLFSLYGRDFPRYGPILKIVIHIFEHETWTLGKVSEVARIFSFYPRGERISLQDRLCEFYSKNVIEDEEHFLFRCDLYHDLRQKSLGEITDGIRNVEDDAAMARI